MTDSKKPLAEQDFKIGGFTQLSWDIEERVCTLTVPPDQHSFKSIELLWKAGKWLKVSISSVGCQIGETEQVRQYKFLGQIETVQPINNGSLVKIKMHEDKPEIISINLNEGTI